MTPFSKSKDGVRCVNSPAVACVVVSVEFGTVSSFVPSSFWTTHHCCLRLPGDGAYCSLDMGVVVSGSCLEFRCFRGGASLQSSRVGCVELRPRACLPIWSENGMI